mgnify:CR=1 FL=1
MKKFIVLISVVATGYTFATAQPCLPDGITFSSQAQIDNFQTDYPGCTVIEGGVSIQGNDITNLNGLSVLTSIGGNLMIGSYAAGNPSVSSLTGLDNLTSIGGYLWLKKNPLLSNLNGLEELTSIGTDLIIWHNDALSTLSGMGSLAFVGGTLVIEYNASLTSLTGLEGLTSIGGELLIGYHISLTSLAGLDNIEAGSITNLIIRYNPSLSTCEVQSICDYLTSPNGTVDIAFNASGCNNQAEVTAACETLGIEGALTLKDFSVSPNPFSDQLSIAFDLGQNTLVSIQLFNIMGKKIAELHHGFLQTGPQQIMISAGDLPKGIYFCRVQTNSESTIRKIIKH